MNSAHADGRPSAAIVLRLVLLIDIGTAYCVPEAGINYKRQIRARNYRREILANFPAMG
jgi:hypothetical protein